MRKLIILMVFGLGIQVSANEQDYTDLREQIASWISMSQPNGLFRAQHPEMYPELIKAQNALFCSKIAPEIKTNLCGEQFEIFKKVRHVRAAAVAMENAAHQLGNNDLLLSAKEIQAKSYQTEKDAVFSFAKCASFYYDSLIGPNKNACN